MAKYNTGNALGSADPRDLFDNSQIADHYVSDTENNTWQDRFGNERKTWKGIETDAANQLAAEENSFQQFLLNSGYEILADYTDGPITFTRRNQITAYNGEFYRPKASVTLPYTTTGNTATTWAADEANFVALGDAVIRKELAAQLGYSLIGQVASFADLRLLVPAYAGQRVLLASWNKDITPYGQSSFGGDEFVAVSGSYADDGGFTAKVSDSWAWQRCRNINEATVLHFGGVPGGDFDNHDAIINMHLWSQNIGATTGPGIVFPAGNFHSSPLDFTTSALGVNNHAFKLKGPKVTHGRNCLLTLTSDKSSKPAIKIEAYDIDMAYFNFDGQATLVGGSATTGQNTIQGGTPSNTQPFLENIQTGPQNIHISYWYITNLGGLGFKLSDSLDTKFHETYCNGVYGGLFNIGYDNQVSGSWNHPTAVEWSNTNYQACYPEPLIYAPRLRQALMTNFWAERCNPGDLTDSQVVMTSVCIEDAYLKDNSTPCYLDLFNSNFTVINSDLLSPKFIRTGYDVDTAWNSSFLPGQSMVEPHGIMTSHGTIASRLESSPLLIDATSNSVETWYAVGHFGFENIGSSVNLRITGGFNPVWDTTATYPWSTQHGGYSEINIQRKSSGDAQHVNWSNHGGPVTDVRFTGGGGADLYLYVKIAINALCSIRATSSTPGDVMGVYRGSGVSATRWFGDVVKQDPPSDARTPMTSWINRAGWQTDTSGNARQGALGIASDGRLIAGAATLDLMSGESSSGVTRNLVLYIDGVPYAITATQITTS